MGEVRISELEVMTIETPKTEKQNNKLKKKTKTNKKTEEINSNKKTQKIIFEKSKTSTNDTVLVEWEN